MNKATIRSNLSIFESDIAATHAKGLRYILGYVVILSAGQRVYAQISLQ